MASSYRYRNDVPRYRLPGRDMHFHGFKYGQAWAEENRSLERTSYGIDRHTQRPETTRGTSASWKDPITRPRTDNSYPYSNSHSLAHSERSADLGRPYHPIAEPRIDNSYSRPTSYRRSHSSGSAGYDNSYHPIPSTYDVPPSAYNTPHRSMVSAKAVSPLGSRHSHESPHDARALVPSSSSRTGGHVHGHPTPYTSDQQSFYRPGSDVLERSRPTHFPPQSLEREYSHASGYEAGDDASTDVPLSSGQRYYSGPETLSTLSSLSRSDTAETCSTSGGSYGHASTTLGSSANYSIMSGYVAQGPSYGGPPGLPYRDGGRDVYYSGEDSDSDYDSSDSEGIYNDDGFSDGGYSDGGYSDADEAGGFYSDGDYSD